MGAESKRDLAAETATLATFYVHIHAQVYEPPRICRCQQWTRLRSTAFVATDEKMISSEHVQFTLSQLSTDGRKPSQQSQEMKMIGG